MNRRVLISGAGIAGSAVAWWLQRGGDEVTLVERAPAPRRGGQTVDLRGAGRTVIERMGLLPAVREVTVQQRGIAWVDGRGRRRAEMPVTAFGGRGVISSDEVLRGDLADVLLGAVGADAELIFDDSLTTLAQDPDGVDVTFRSGRTGRYDLVIGADGLHSAVRRLAFGPEDRFVRPLDLLTAWFTVPAEVELDGWYLMHNAPGGRVATLRPGRVPTEQKAGLSVRGTGGYDRRDINGQRRLIAERFADVGWEAPRLVDRAQRAEDFFCESIGQVWMDRMARGRVALIGDAGCCPSPLTGLGTSLALVGGYVLAGELSRSQTSDIAAVTQAFDRFHRIVGEYVQQARQLPPGGVGGYAPMRAGSIRAGGVIMGLVQRWPASILMDRVFSHADAIDLPDYEAVQYAR